MLDERGGDVHAPVFVGWGCGTFERFGCGVSFDAAYIGRYVRGRSIGKVLQMVLKLNILRGRAHR